ncbi:hypothetical protein ACFE04_005558 [Oxalis oulophora]
MVSSARSCGLVKNTRAMNSLIPILLTRLWLMLHVLSTQVSESMPAIMKQNSECTRISHAFNKLLNQIGNPSDFELPEGPSAGSSGVCDRDCHCGMLLSSCSPSCKCGSECLNKPFQHRPIKQMSIVQTEKCGAGIVADEDIREGEFIIEYVGEVIDDKICAERLWNMKHRGETNFYLCEIKWDMVIDATYKGNKSRYINHSCSPNTQMQKWRIDGETRIGIFASRNIKKGEHLTYDYQFVQFGADQVCHCGAVECRQKLGVKPNKPKLSSDAALKLVESQVAPKSKAILSREKNVSQFEGLHTGSSNHVNNRKQPCSSNCIGEVIRLSRPMDNNRRFGIIKRFDSYTRKHAVMFEDGALEFFDLSKEDWELVAL